MSSTLTPSRLVEFHCFVLHSSWKRTNRNLVIQHHCALPTSPLPASTLTFDIHPTSTHILVLGFPNNTIQIFDVEARDSPSWARNVNSRLPSGLERLPDGLVGLAFIKEDSDHLRVPSIEGSVNGDGGDGSVLGQNRATGSYLPKNVVLWGRGWLCRIDLMAGVGMDRRRSRSLSHSSSRLGTPLTASSTPQSPHLPALKRKHSVFGGAAVDILPRLVNGTGEKSNELGVAAKIDRNGSSSGGAIVTKYRDMLLVDFLGPREMVIVERPMGDVLQTLNPAFYKPKYGAK